MDNCPLSPKKNILLDILAFALYVLGFSLFCFLYLLFVRGHVLSDIPSHVATVIGGHAGYSLAHTLIGVCFRMPFPRETLAVLLALLVAGTAVGMYVYLRSRAGSRWPNALLLLLGLALVFTGNLWIPEYFPHFYTHYTTVSQPWHNSTYTLMRFFSVFVLALYFKLFSQVARGEFSFRDGILFCVALSLCNYAKPNFFLAFAPASLLVFVWLLLAARGKNAVALFKWGCFFVLSAVCMVFMFRIVYDPSEHSSIAVSSKEFIDYVSGTAGVNGHRGQFWICGFSNLLFPLFVLAVFCILKFRGRGVEFGRLLQGFLFFVFGHLEQLFLVEDGPRKLHGNYAWGVYCVGMLLFLVCLAEWLRAYDKRQLQNKLVFGVGLAIFAAHILCGIWYFALLCRGQYYVL